MFIPVGPDGGLQDVWTVDKDEKGMVSKTRLFGVRVSSFLPGSYSNDAGIFRGTALPRE
jgi:hypothetical protein